MIRLYRFFTYNHQNSLTEISEWRIMYLYQIQVHYMKTIIFKQCKDN